MKVVRVSEFASVMGIAERSAREAFRQGAMGKTWRKITLPIIELEGEQGGASGKVRGLVVDALPPEMRAKFEPSLNALQTPFQTLVEDEKKATATKLACWRWSIIQDVYAMPSGPERTAAIASLTKRKHHFDGSETTVSQTTVYDWMKRYAEGGFSALSSEARADRGKRRVQISRNWDTKIDFDAATKERVGQMMDAYAKAFIRSDGSLRKLAHIGTRRLVELCQQEGSEIPVPELAQLCKLNSKWTSRFAEFKRVARKERQAALRQGPTAYRAARSCCARPSYLW